MPDFSTPAILLRRIAYGDYDLIITFFTPDRGKISTIAKYAKKSTKRFSGILELFSVLNIVCTVGKGKGLPVLQEAALDHPFPNIRTDILKTAYAAYWTELIYEWMESRVKQTRLYHLLFHVLNRLDLDNAPEKELSIIFQMRFLSISGLNPNLSSCNSCKTETGLINQNKIILDPSKGGLVCDKCHIRNLHGIYISRGVIKELLWIESGNLAKADRIKFSDRAVKEGLLMLESFISFHLSKKLKSLKFLKQIRDN